MGGEVGTGELWVAACVFVRHTSGSLLYGTTT